MRSHAARAAVSHAAIVTGSLVVWATVDEVAAVIVAIAAIPAAAWWLDRSVGRAGQSALSETTKKLQTALAERLEVYRGEVELREGILEAMQEAVIVVEGDQVAYANAAARTLLGAQQGRPPPPHVPVEDGGDFDVHHPTFRSLRSITADMPGDRRVVVAQDVTETKRTDAIRRDFVANASHELKTPVAAILATAETLKDAARDDPAASARFADTLAREAARLAAMIQDLLDLARLEQPRGRAHPTEWSALVRAAVEEARGHAEARTITIAADLADPIVVDGREQDLAQLARNLLDNAVSYTPDGGKVEVSLSAGDGHAVLAVTDSGIGIPAKELPRIFERFYRVDRARARETGGTGLGLSIVKHVAESHGGSVQVESQLERGSVFTVRLPLAT